MKWLIKYNTLKIKSYITIRNLQNEITNLINEKENLNSVNKDLIKKNTRLKKENRELKVGGIKKWLV